MMKNAYLPKITILLQFGDEILALSNRLEPGENCKDLYGVTGALKGQYLIPKLQ